MGLFDSMFGKKTKPQLAEKAQHPSSKKPPAAIHEPSPAFPELSASLSSLVRGQNAFALDLYARLRDASGNLFYSPFSISTALAMTYAGARGETERQMAGVLHFDLPREELHAACGELAFEMQANALKHRNSLFIANAIWGQLDFAFLDAFTGILRDRYGSELHAVDFREHAERICGEINAWVARKTEDKIQNLIGDPAMLEGALLVLVNAIYFKGDWAVPFEPQLTRPGDFHGPKGKRAAASFMLQCKTVPYYETPDYQAVELPYAGGEMALAVLLPRTADGLEAFERTLTPSEWEAVLRGLRHERVAVTLPKFKTTRDFSLGDALKAMGMPAAFEDGADFSGMSGRPDLKISRVIHKAFVEVNEKGTEAAAATAVLMMYATGIPAAQPEPKIFKADRPFVFLIRDRRTGAILFAGRMTEPIAP